MSRLPKHVVTTDAVARSVGHYSTAIRSGDLLYVSGMLATNSADERVGDTIEEQTQQTLENIAHVLNAAGASMNDVIKVTSYLVDYDHFEAYDAVYAQHFADPPPARMTCVVGLRPEYLIEIDVIAQLAN